MIATVVDNVNGLEPLREVLNKVCSDIPSELVRKMNSTLSAEGISTMTHLLQTHEVDFEKIVLPALLKSRLRRIRTLMFNRREAESMSNTMAQGGQGGRQGGD